METSCTQAAHLIAFGRAGRVLSPTWDLPDRIAGAGRILRKSLAIAGAGRVLYLGSLAHRNTLGGAATVLHTGSFT